MEKIKALIKWVGTDGLLHFLVAYALTLTLAPMVGSNIAIAITSAVAIGKEAYDIIKKTNNIKQALHDLICDCAGVLASCCAIALWWIINF